MSPGRSQEKMQTRLEQTDRQIVDDTRGKASSLSFLVVPLCPYPLIRSSAASVIVEGRSLTPYLPKLMWCPALETIVWPVMALDSSEAKNTAVLANSDGNAGLLNEKFAFALFSASSNDMPMALALLAIILSRRSPLTPAALMQLTRMPYSPTSWARVSVRPITPILAQQ